MNFLNNYASEKILLKLLNNKESKLKVLNLSANLINEDIGNILS